MMFKVKSAKSTVTPLL